MARFLFLIVLALIVAASWFVIRYSKDTYRLLPIDQTANVQNQSNYESWHEYEQPSGKFKVLLPSIPQHVADKSIDPKTKQARKYDTYLSENNTDGTIYMITQIAYPDPLAAQLASDEILTNIMNDMVAAKPENQLKDMQKGEYHGHHAIDFTMDNDQFGYIVKAFVVDNTLYVLSSISKKGVDTRKDFDFFVNSFDLPVSSK